MELTSSHADRVKRIRCGNKVASFKSVRHNQRTIQVAVSMRLSLRTNRLVRDIDQDDNVELDNST
jgi:hypothetical protein